MPDGDEVHKSLDIAFRKAYNRLCKGQMSDSELVVLMVESTSKKIQSYGDEAIQLITQLAKKCEEVRAQLPLFASQVDWLEARNSLEKIAQDTCMDKRAKTLVLQVGREQLQRLHQGKIDVESAQTMMNAYGAKVYRADFEALVVSGPDHRYQAKSLEVNTRLASIKSQVLEKLRESTDRLSRTETVQTLSYPVRRGSKKSISLDKNLLDM